MTAIASIVMTKARDSAIWAPCSHPQAIVTLDGMGTEHCVVSTPKAAAKSVTDNP
jgi:hypothetical protein